MDSLLKSNLDFATMGIMDRLGDNNKAVKEKAEAIAMGLIANQEIAGPGFIIGHIVRA